MTAATALRIGAAELAGVLGQPQPTAEQLAIIEAPLAPGLVVAGAGSGKTETMAARVVWLVANHLVRPEQVLGLTFTRKAAGELSSRIGQRLRQLGAAHVVEVDVILAGEPTVFTYHAYAARIVAEHGLRLGVEPTSRLLSDAVRWQYAASIVGSYDGDMSFVGLTPATITAEVLDLADQLGEHLVDPERLRAFTVALVARIEALTPARSNLPGGVYDKVRRMLDRQLARLQLLPLVEAYVDRKRSAEAMDYGDQMGVAAQLARDTPEIARLERERHAAVLLDEYQDTSHSQLVLLRALFGDGHPVTAVGDPCQSIYGWRGASAGSLQRFPTHFAVPNGTLLPDPAEVTELSVSWRNDERILQLANAVAAPLRAHGAQVPVLRPAPAGRGGGTVCCALLETAEEEADWLAGQLARIWRDNSDRLARGEGPRTAAVLTRKRAQQRMLETALRARGVPVEVLGLGGLLDTPEVLDVVSNLRVAVDPTAGDALMRLLTGARWRLGPRDVAALGKRARVLTQAPAGADPAIEFEWEQGSIVDALDDLGPPGGYSAEGWLRLRLLRDELRALRRRLDQPLPDLIADVERTIGLDIEVAVRRPRDQALARGHLDAFLDVAADFQADSEAASLTAFLSYLRAAEEQERGLEAGIVERPADAVQVLTVHGAKGLEWDVVAIPGLTKDVFPSKDRTDDIWTTKLGAVPYPLRGDCADLPVFDLSGCADQKDADLRLPAFVQSCAAISAVEERRLAYVAMTRARSELLCSGYWWDEAVGMRGPSALLREVHEHCRAGGGEVARWADEPAPGSVNPRRALTHTAGWPVDPLGSRRGAVEDAAARVLAVAADPGAVTAGEWTEEVDLLLAERDTGHPGGEAGYPGGDEVELPEHLSVSQLVTLRRDPESLAAQIRRPMPYPPAPLARRGTAFHAWLEQRYGGSRLLDVDELPGAQDAGGDDSDLTVLQEAFLASEWAERTPVEVEVPFEFRVGALVLRGRMDAVFTDADGRYEVVDWKTGQLPTGADAAAAAVQLAAYRLAWAELAGVPVGSVGAAFHYVRHDRTVRPADLLDADGLGALIDSLPAGQEG